MRAWAAARSGTLEEVAETMERALFRFDGTRYRLMAWCIMPNHVHVVIKPEMRLAGIVQSWKAFTGRWR